MVSLTLSLLKKMKLLLAAQEVGDEDRREIASMQDGDL